MHFQRTEQLLGHEAFERIRRSFVVVVGLGVVGGQAAEALARAGVGRLRLAITTRYGKATSTVRFSQLGTRLAKKAEVAWQRIRSISPDCQVEALDTFLGQVLTGDPDVVIDVID